MLTKLKQSSVVQSGDFQAGGLYPLSFVILEEGLTLITQDSLFRYLEIDHDTVLADAGLMPARFCFFYDDMGEEGFGIPLMQVPAFCINIFERCAQTGEYKQASLNAMMLLIFFTSSGLTTQIGKATMLNSSEGAVIVPIQGLGS